MFSTSLFPFCLFSCTSYYLDPNFHVNIMSQGQQHQEPSESKSLIVGALATSTLNLAFSFFVTKGVGVFRYHCQNETQKLAVRAWQRCRSSPKNKISLKQLNTKRIVKIYIVVIKVLVILKKPQIPSPKWVFQGSWFGEWVPQLPKPCSNPPSPKPRRMPRAIPGLL